MKLINRPVVNSGRKFLKRMTEEQKQLKKIYWLLFGGGCFVVFAYLPMFFFDPATSWTLWWIDNVFHTFGGAYAFFFSRALWRYAKMHYQIALPFGGEVLIWIGGALIIGVFWEWYELIVDRYEVFILHVPSIMTYADNIGDLAFDTFGAVIAAIFLWRRNKR